MQWIERCQEQDNGLYSAVIRNIELSNKGLLVLDNGLDVERREVKMNKILMRFAINYIKYQEKLLTEKEAHIKYLEGFLKGKGH